MCEHTVGYIFKSNICQNDGNQSVTLCCKDEDKLLHCYSTLLIVTVVNITFTYSVGCILAANCIEEARYLTGFSQSQRYIAKAV